MGVLGGARNTPGTRETTAGKVGLRNQSSTVFHVSLGFHTHRVFFLTLPCHCLGLAAPRQVAAPCLWRTARRSASPTARWSATGDETAAPSTSRHVLAGTGCKLADAGGLCVLLPSASMQLWAASNPALMCLALPLSNTAEWQRNYGHWLLVLQEQGGRDRRRDARAGKRSRVPPREPSPHGWRSATSSAPPLP